MARPVADRPPPPAAAGRRHRAACGCRAAPGASRALPSDPFTLGVASGSPTHDSVVLWTRLAARRFSDRARRRSRHACAGRSRTTTSSPASSQAARRRRAPSWRIRSTWKCRASSRTAGTSTASWPGDAESADRPHPHVPGARCGRRTPARSPTRRASAGSTATSAPIGTCARTTRTSCCSWATTSTNIPSDRTRCACRRGGWVRRSTTTASATRCTSRDPDLQAMHAACPWLVTWDDHEVQNDYAGLQGRRQRPAGRRTSPRGAPRPTRRTTSTCRCAPRRSRGRSPGSATAPSCASIRSVRFGTLATFYLLDDRQYRDPQACTRDGQAGSSTVDPARAPTGTTPRARCSAPRRNAGSTARSRTAAQGWNVLGQQTLFGQRDFRPGPGQLALERRLGRLPRGPRAA